MGLGTLWSNTEGRGKREQSLGMMQEGRIQALQAPSLLLQEDKQEGGWKGTRHTDWGEQVDSRGVSTLQAGQVWVSIPWHWLHSPTGPIGPTAQAAHSISHPRAGLLLTFPTSPL